MKGWASLGGTGELRGAGCVCPTRSCGQGGERGVHRRTRRCIAPRAGLERAPTRPSSALGWVRTPRGRRHSRSIGSSAAFFVLAVSGVHPKFDCELESGVKVKVKYGRENAEVYADVIASRLLAALGFPADRMYVVDRVRCYGCPADPFAGLQCVNDGGSIEGCFPNLDETKYVEFDTAVIEQPLKGRRVETRLERGWKWEELDKSDPAAGGAPRAHVDALRLLAVFLNHWDNKAKNQRLLCLGEEDPPGPVFVATPARNHSP